MTTIRLDVVLIMIRYTCPALNSCSTRFSGNLYFNFSNLYFNFSNLHFNKSLECLTVPL